MCTIDPTLASDAAVPAQALKTILAGNCLKTDLAVSMLFSQHAIYRSI